MLKIKRYNLTEDTPGVEVLHVKQKSCNASVECNTYFLAGYRPVHCPAIRKCSIYPHNMEEVITFALTAQILTILKHI
jgi:hypothetical protein